MKTESKQSFTETSKFYPRGGGEPKIVTIVHNVGPFERGRCIKGDEKSAKTKAIMPTCHF